MAVVPRFGWWLRILPSRLERRFWQSQVFVSYAHALDRFAVHLTIGISANMLLLLKDDMFECFTVPAKPLFVGFLLQSLVQRVVMAVRTQHYLRWRHAYILVGRLTRLCVLVHLLVHLRHQINSGCAYPCAPPRPPPAAPTPASPLPTLLPAARGLMVASLATLPFLHGCTMPLPLLPQALLHTLSAAVVLTSHLLPAVALLRSEPCTAQLNKLCTYTSSLISFFQRLLLTLPANHDHMTATCDKHAARVLILFLTLYFGYGLPIYVAYRLERKLKEDFLLELHHANPDDVDLRHITFVSVPHLLDVMVPVALAVLTWINIVYLHQFLALHTYAV